MRQRPVVGLRTGGGVAAVDIRCDPAFVEETVFLALRRRAASGDHALAQAFHAERDALYDVGGPAAERDTAFQRLASRYFQTLGFAALFAQRFAECPFLADRIQAAVVRRVWSRKEERVELYASDASGRPAMQGLSMTLLLGLQAERCLETPQLTSFLRHELLHVSDMLDPAFAYDPHPALGGACDAEDDVTRERFALLWNLVVDGRMRRQGWPAPVEDTARRRDFERAFAGWDAARRQAVWQALDARTSWTQRELLALAQDERLTRMLGAGGVRCPLCHFPTSAGVRDWQGERAAITEVIRADYPQWEPAQGACLQCVELYRSRVPAAT